LISFFALPMSLSQVMPMVNSSITQWRLMFWRAFSSLEGTVNTDRGLAARGMVSLANSDRSAQPSGTLIHTAQKPEAAPTAGSSQRTAAAPNLCPSAHASAII
jgi:hypothetical protein